MNQIERRLSDFESKTNNVTYILLQLCDVFEQTQHSTLKHTNMKKQKI